MNRIRIIPVLLIQNAGLVKSVQFKMHKYVGDPINTVKIFNEKEVDEIIVLDIDATAKNKRPDVKRIEEICGEAFMPLAYGGGIKTLEDAQQILYSGAEKIIVNTCLIENPKLIEEIAKQYGSQSLVASIDYKNNIFGKPKVFAKNARKKTNWNPIDLAKKAEDYGAGEVMLTSIDRDGTYNGYDINMIEKVSGSINVPLIACGGASGLKDFEKAYMNGASALAAGSIFVFQRPHQAVLISYPTQQDLGDKFSSKI